MLNFKKIEIDIKDNLITIWLNRPETHNALNSLMLKEITEIFRWTDKRKDIKVIMIRGKGKSFCAGADLKQIAKHSHSGFRKSYSDSKDMAGCFSAIYGSDKVVLNLIHGNVYGGGLGFLGAGDFTFALKNTVLSLPELRLGLVPAVIMPYLLSKIKLSVIKYQVYTGGILTAEEALRKGLIEYVFENMEDMEKKADETCRDICQLPSDAIEDTKNLLRSLNKGIINPANVRRTIQVITKRKLSDETTKRIADFISVGQADTEKYNG